jgi:hypothetical protein
MTEAVAKDQAEFYEFRIKEHLDPRWSDWFEGLTMTYPEAAETILSGFVTDQSALHGMLAKIRDLNLILISVAQTKPTQARGEKHENSECIQI